MLQRGILLLILAIAILLATSTLHAQGCEPCPDDTDPSTNCTEARIEILTSRPNPTCYRLIVLNNQYSPTSTAQCTQYNADRFITIELLNPICYDSIHLSITPKTPGRFLVSSDSTRPTGYVGVVHPSKIIFENIADPSQRCTADTFDICIGCIQEIEDLTCALDDFDWRVYYSDSSGSATCINESGATGRTFAQVKPRVPLCPEADPSCGCPTYASVCNTWSVHYGCDYAEITIINDHGYPTCGPLNKIEFMVLGAHRCQKAVTPTFRAWNLVETFDTNNNRMHYLYYPQSGDPGLAPCDTFRMRIPFCCPEGAEYITVQPGIGFCEHYTLIDDGMQPGAIHKYEEPFACTECYLEKDVAVYKAKGGGASPGQPHCDTLVIYNRNTSSACGTDAGGNSPIYTIDLQTAQCASVAVISRPGWTPTAQGGGAYRIQTSATALQPCDSLVIVLCNCTSSGVVEWTTRDEDDNELGSGRTGNLLKRPTAPPPLRSVGSAGTLGTALPTPSNGRVTIPLHVGALAGDASARIRVYDMAGALRQERQQSVHANTSIAIELDASAWSNGTYAVQVELEGSTLTQTFLLQK